MTPETAGTVEAPFTLDLDRVPPQPLGFRDQAALWASLGVTLTIPAAAVFVLAPVPGLPPLALGAAVVAVLLGTVLGSLLLGAAAVPGAVTGAPAMALLRGLLGHRASVLPTVLNLAQCVGWAAVEVLVITEVATRLTSESWRLGWALLAGATATAMAVRPLGSVHLLRRYLMWAVGIATVVLFIGVLRNGLPATPEGTWTTFWPAFDLVIALPVSWAPLAADYSRHSHSTGAAFRGAALGYSVAAVAYFLLGIAAVLTVSGAADSFSPTDFIPALLALPAGAVALVILLVDEVDEAFANVYSTAMSAQNLVPGIDRRVLAVVVGVLATALALLVDLVQYESFLFLIGAVFVPLMVMLLVDWYLVRRIVGGAAGAGYDVVHPGAGRWLMLAPWALGFVAYTLVSPGTVPGWSQWWLDLREALGFVPPLWLSATLLSAVVAGALTLLVGLPLARRATVAA